MYEFDEAIAVDQDAGTVWFPAGRTLDDAVMEGWVSFADGRPIDTLSLPMFADALPLRSSRSGRSPRGRRRSS